MRLENLDRFDWVMDTAREWLQSGESLDLTILCGDRKTKLKCHKLMLQQFLQNYSGQSIHSYMDLVILPEFNIEEVQDYLALIYGFREQKGEIPNGDDVETDDVLGREQVKVEIGEDNEESKHQEGFEVSEKEEDKVDNSSEEQKDVKVERFEEKHSVGKEDSEEMKYQSYGSMTEKCPDKIKYCHICGETFQFSRLAYVHMISKHDLQELTQRKLTFKDHGRVGVKMFKCDMEFCEEFFDLKRSMKRHVKSSHQGKSCKVCGKIFPSWPLLNAHIKDKHPEKVKESKLELCSDCGENVSRSGMTSHMLYKHKKDISTKEFRYFCSSCDYKCRGRNQLNEHNRLHTGEKPEVCTFCGKAFRSKRTRDNHERLHTNERPYSCSQCPERFVQSTSLASHRKSRHKDKVVQD